MSRSAIRCKNPDCRCLIAYLRRNGHIRLESGAAYTPDAGDPTGIICPKCGWLQYPKPSDAEDDEAA